MTDIDEDPLPEGYRVHTTQWHALADNSDAPTNGELGSVWVAGRSTYKAAVRACWAHVQGLL